MPKIEIEETKAYRLINNGCVVLVTSYHKGRPNVMPLAWQMPVSAKPPLVAVGVAESHFTYELVRKSGEFVINVPNKSLLSQVVRCGRVSGKEVDKFELTGLSLARAHSVMTPLVDECIGHLECSVVDVYPTGDHGLFVGEVLSASVEEGLFEECWVEDERTVTLHHLGGDVFIAGGERIVYRPSQRG